VTEVTYDIGNSGSHSECTVLTVTLSVGSDSYRHVTEVTYETGNSGSYSDCTVHTVTVSVGSDSYRHVTEVTYDIGQSGIRNECTVPSVGSDPPRSCDRDHLSHLKCFMYGTSLYQHSAAPFWLKCRVTLCSPCII
jgi:hypothetical protein